MATVMHIIRSHYDPADRERLEHETGQRTSDHSDPWQTESSFSAQRPVRAAPSFVPATISYDEWGAPSHTSSPAPASNSALSSSPTAEWYRSLTTASVPRNPPPLPARPLSAPSPGTRDARAHQTRAGKNDWFISAALHSEPSAKTNPAGPPSLADLLARDPPPLPSEGRFRPPVWLHIGPSNKGFGMLQRSGWNEGEGLGAHVARSVARARDVDKLAPSSVKMEKDTMDTETMPEVHDLTASDSEALEDASEDFDVTLGPARTQAGEESASHMQKSLLTPLPTILKADRLGIGLKAKTEGPYKQSRKRVTHGAAALAAHIKSAQEMRRKKMEVGKGRRGFAKVHKREEEWRKSMLAYLNE